MDDRTALLAAVCARPDDDTPRLVFADYLDDHGDPECARFIRAQVELARVLGWDRRWVLARHRDHALFEWRRYREFSFLPLPLRKGLTFRRGFPWNVEFPSPGDFADRADELFALAPFQSLTVLSDHRLPPPNVAPLADDPRLTRLRRLSFQMSRFDAAAVRRLADSPHLAGVTELRLEYDALTPDGVGELLRAGLPGRLTALAIRYIAPTWAAALAEYDGPSTVRRLEVFDSWLAGGQVAAVFAGPLFRGLVELDLSQNSLGPAGVAALAASPAAATLESLNLERTAPGVAGVRALAACPALTNLRHLSLGRNDLGPVAARALAQSPHLRNLSILDLTDNIIGDKGALALAASPYLRNLAELELFGAGLTDAGVAALLESPVTAGLVRLGVSGNLSVDTYTRLRERFG